MKSYCFEIIFEILKWVSTGYFWRKHLYLVHVSNECYWASATNSTPSGHEQRATGCCNDPVDTRHGIKDLLENKNIQLSVLSA